MINDVWGSSQPQDLCWWVSATSDIGNEQQEPQ